MKKSSKIVLLFSMTYMISYITRINYSAVISEMELATQFSKQLLSMAVTASAVTYGAGQIISGIFGDKFSPKRLILLGLALSATMNFVIPVCQTPWQMAVAWGINGFAQAFMWPPLVRLMVALLSTEEYKKATVRVSWGSNVGTILVYCTAPVVIMFLSWKAVFPICGAMALAMMIFWQKLCPEVSVREKVKSETDNKSSHSWFSPLLLCVMLAVVLQGMLRDGVTTWMPTYINETYNLGSGMAILSGAVLPLFSILCIEIASKLHKNVLEDPMMCAGAIFGVGALASVLLLAVGGYSSVASIAFMALLTGSMHGVNLMLVCMMPPYFAGNGNVSAVSGVINSCTYIGSAVSTYGIAVITENYDWNVTIGLWIVIAVFGSLSCFLGCKRS